MGKYFLPRKTIMESTKYALKSLQSILITGKSDYTVRLRSMYYTFLPFLVTQVFLIILIVMLFLEHQ